MKHLREDEVQVSLLWLALGLAVVTAIGRGFWLYRASLTWPTADGIITRLDVDRQRDAGADGGHYFGATFSYDFRDPQGHRMWEPGTRIFPVKLPLANLPNENCHLGKKLWSGSVRKIPA